MKILLKHLKYFKGITMKTNLCKTLSICFFISIQIFTFQIVYSEGEGELKQNINDIKVLDMDSSLISLSDYSDMVLLIVNVASECGYTPQYEELEKLYKTYNSQGFEILAFPCNDFGGQEPGTNEEINTFCSSNYGITFQLFDKVKILGEDKSALYERLTNNDVTEKSDIKWNFEKFIISKNGNIVARFFSKVEPTDLQITKLIEEELNKD